MNYQLKTAVLHPPGLGAALAALGDKSDLCVKVLDSSGVITHANDRAFDILGVQPTDFCGNAWHELWEAREGCQVRDAVARALLGVSTEMTLRFGDSGGVWDISVTPLRQPDGEIEHVLAISKKLAETDVPGNTNAKPAKNEVQKAPNDGISSRDELLGEALHALGNLLAAVESGTRLMERHRSSASPYEIMQNVSDSSTQARAVLARIRERFDTLHGGATGWKKRG